MHALSSCTWPFSFFSRHENRYPCHFDRGFINEMLPFAVSISNERFSFTVSGPTDWDLFVVHISTWMHTFRYQSDPVHTHNLKEKLCYASMSFLSDLTIYFKTKSFMWVYIFISLLLLLNTRYLKRLWNFIVYIMNFMILIFIKQIYIKDLQILCSKFYSRFLYKYKWDMIFY